MPHSFLPAAVATLLFSVPLAAQTESVLSSLDIAPAGVAAGCQRDGITDALWTCLDAAGLPPGGLLFAQRLANDPRIGEPGVATGFVELGVVDLAEVEFPFRANTNVQPVFVNGARGALLPQTLTAENPGDPQSLALQTAHPQAFGDARLRVTGHRAANGLQRFVLMENLTDGCRACEIVGAELRAVEFRDGVLQRVEQLGWLPPAQADDEARNAALSAGDLQAVQVALTLRGYQPGLMDGASRAETIGALEAFMSDNCLTPQSTAPQAALALLAAPGPYLDTPPCPAVTAAGN
ncbi:hypothetical protein [Pararhodobacter zhoushanensis]|uniref:Peptidoglycan binding-like domain-containing protein n=1 Tax=Pararhodobacter zhoushanensis TaxID=2479545 RepID=A0ABT3GYV3_9RHOB|nr:hypothetical protein [Pararhodobacter zhoushanensis]MCW1932716.1 hypothetical protein [Pararhodobacter zhoushanensis]